MTRANRHRYRAWDGRQSEGLSADTMLRALGERLLDGDIDRELDRAMYQGIADEESDEHIGGLDQLRAQIRAQRHDLEQQLQSLTGRLGSPREHETPSRSACDGGIESLPESIRPLASAPGLAGQTLRGLDEVERQRLRADLEAYLDGTRRGHVAPLERALEIFADLLDLADLEDHLRRIRTVADVQEIDLDRIALALGQDAAMESARLRQSLLTFRASGFIRDDGRRTVLSARALQTLGDSILREAFTQLRSRSTGDHAASHAGQPSERGSDSRRYEFGAPFDLDLGRSVLQAVKRGSGTPVRLAVEDMLVFERETSSRVATVLAVDLSRSMGERGYLLAAKRLSLALTTLIDRRFPRDHLHILGFSHEAREVTAMELPDLTWDRHELGTNVQDALRAARARLGRYPGLQHNLILVTDGEPTAYRAASGEVRYSEPPSDEALARTYAEAASCKRAGIDLLVALLSEDEKVVNFVERLANAAGGRYVVCRPDEITTGTLLTYASKRANLP